MVDFQGVCLKRALRQEKSAGGHFRGVCSHLLFHSFSQNKIISSL